jgi:hypothetical protein
MSAMGERQMMGLGRDDQLSIRKTLSYPSSFVELLLVSFLWRYNFSIK